MVTAGRITALTRPSCRARQAVAGAGRRSRRRSAIWKLSCSRSLSCCSSGTISFSARICMRWRSVAIRSLVTCWMKAMTPAVKMAKTPRIRLLRRIERAGVRGLCMSVHLAQTAFGLCVAIGARRRVVINGRSAEIHQQHREGDGVRVVAPHPDNVYQNTDPGTEDQPAPGAGGTGYRIGNDEE